MRENKMGRSLQETLTRVVILILMMCLVACGVTKVPNIPYVNQTTRGAVGGATGGAVLGAIGGFGGPVGAAIGGLAGTIIGHDLKRNNSRVLTLEKELGKAGLRFVRLGEEYKLILPTDYFFYLDSPRLRHTGRYYLNTLAEYLSFFEITTIRVAAFTDNQNLPERNMALSRAQAAEVVEYLSKHNMDVRVITGRGFGSDYPIANNRSPKGREMNRRVEVMFRLIQPTTIN